MPIEGIQEGTDNVTPSRNHVMRLHEIKRNQSEHDASISWNYVENAFQLIDIWLSALTDSQRFDNVTTQEPLNWNDVSQFAGLNSHRSMDRWTLTNQIWNKQENVLLSFNVSRHLDVCYWLMNHLEINVCKMLIAIFSLKRSNNNLICLDYDENECVSVFAI